MTARLRVGVVVVLVGLVSLAGSAAPAGPERFRDLPRGWKLVTFSMVRAAQVRVISDRLGGGVIRVSNAVLSADGQGIRVNSIGCATEQDAERIHKLLVKAKGNPALCRQDGKTVVEFLCEDVRLARRAHYALGLQPETVAYKVSFQIAPVDEADYMSANSLFNLFVALERNPADAQIAAQIARTAANFRFGNRLLLRTYGLGERQTRYSFVPEPVKVETLAGGHVTAYTFDRLPRKVGVPYVSVAAQIEAHAFAPLPVGSAPGKELTAPTKHWPGADREVAALTRRITAGRTTDQEKVDAILEWLMPGRNIKFGGPVVGSRHSVKATLSQKQGQCWDFADCFVVLCRASGIPCRQVGGWLHEQSGHIWAEVFLAGKGWQQVDPTAGMACGSEYIPYFTTEDGEMPIVYVAMPRITVLAQP